MTEHKVVPLRQKDEIDDPLTEILRAGAKRLIEQAVEAEFAAFLAAMPISSCRTAVSASSVMGMIRSARSRRGSGRSRWKSPRRGIAGRRRPTSAFAIRRRSCRDGRVGRGASTCFCRRFTCAGFRWAISRKC